MDKATAEKAKIIQKQALADLKKEFMRDKPEPQDTQKKPPRKYGGGGYGR